MTVTRVTRADLEMSAIPALRLQFGDTLQVVGKAADIARVATLLGNSVKVLNRTNFLTMFIGIGVGVLLGIIPLSLHASADAHAAGIGRWAAPRRRSC